MTTPDRRSADEAIEVVRRVADALPRTGPSAILIALMLWRESTPITLAEMRRRLGASSTAGGPANASEQLAQAGIIEIIRPERGNGISLRWIGPHERN